MRDTILGGDGPVGLAAGPLAPAGILAANALNGRP